jgi:phosphoribosylformylglycinamidine cyclo-ligase
VRKVFDVEHGGLDKTYGELALPRGEALLAPTKSYVKPLLALLDQVKVRAVSHITGGGFYENIPRSMGQGMRAKVEKSAIRTLPIFDVIGKVGNIPERDMFNTFNMGVGMCLTVAKEGADKALEILKAHGEDAYIIGQVEPGEGGIILC